MLSPNQQHHAKAFVEYLKATYPLPARFTANLLKSAHPTGKHYGNITLEKETKKAYCRVFEADKQPIYRLLRVIAHEYKHALQFYLDGKDVCTTEAEIEACTFGFHESVKYCDRHAIRRAPWVNHPGIGLRLAA